MDDPAYFNMGSSVEGFTIDYPQAYPIILPKGVYSGQPEEPVLTLAVRDILVCRKDLEESMVYDMLKY